MAKTLIVCPKCHTFYSTSDGKRTMRCESCGTELERVDFDYYKFDSMSAEKRAEFKRQYVLEHYHADLNNEKLNFSSTSIPKFVPMPQSGWVGYIFICGWLALIVCIIGSVFSLVAGGIIYAIILGLAGALSCGSLILFAIVAEDVRHIRNQVDKLHHDQKYQK